MESKVLQKKSQDPCLVCGRPTSRMHLQVQICYGCAAFYRRSVNDSKKYICQNGKGNCNLKKKSKAICRLCRFNSCKELNLKITKSQQQKMICFNIEYIPDKSDPWNVPDMLYQINTNFKKSANPTEKTFTEYFQKSISNLLDASRPKNEPIQTQPKTEVAKTKALIIRGFFKNQFALNTAKLLASCPQFQKIPYDEKLILHDRFWQMLMPLRNLYLSNEYFGKEDTFKCLIDNYQVITFENVTSCLQLNSMSKDNKVFVAPWGREFIRIFEKFKSLKPTFYEFYYICIISLWSFHSLPNLCPETQKIGEEIIKLASEKLHDYYVNQLRMKSYAARQAKLFKIASMVENVIKSKGEMLKALNLFNFGPTAFTFCKFESNYYLHKT